MEENLIFVPGFFQGCLFLETVSVENFWSKFFLKDLNCNQITVTTNNRAGTIGNKFFPGIEGGKWKMCQTSKNPPNFQGYHGKIRGKLKQKLCFLLSKMT